MDNFTIHVRAVARSFPDPPPVAAIGWLPQKRARIRHRFDTVNFSFILAGAGTYRVDGQLQTIQAPAVITQWPGADMDYGPEGSDGWWSELYVIFDAAMESRLRRSGLLPAGRPWWPVGDSAGLQAVLDELRRRCRLRPLADQIDRIDRLAGLAITESLLAAPEQRLSRAEAAVLAIRDQLNLDIGSDLQPDRLAAEHGLSITHFRRLWAQLVGQPPQRWLIEQRLRRACRLLAESEIPIGEVANRSGFSDPLYFARRFRIFAGCCASDYRRRHRAPMT